MHFHREQSTCPNQCTLEAQKWLRRYRSTEAELNSKKLKGQNRPPMSSSQLQHLALPQPGRITDWALLWAPGPSVVVPVGIQYTQVGVYEEFTGSEIYCTSSQSWKAWSTRPQAISGNLGRPKLGSAIQMKCSEGRLRRYQPYISDWKYNIS